MSIIPTILDLRINYGTLDSEGKPIVDEEGNRIGVEMEMGQPGISWSYKRFPSWVRKSQVFRDGKEQEIEAGPDECAECTRTAG